MRSLTRRTPLAIAAVAAAAAIALPASANAAEAQVGATATAVAAPTCPANTSLQNCLIVLYESTALETISDGTNYPTTIASAGVLTSFNVGVSAITSDKTQLASVISGLNKTYGGPPEVAITVLRQVGKTGKWRWQVAAESAPVNVSKYLGQVVQLPLAQNIPVVPGEVVALTVPTWAPVLSYGLDNTKFAYRQSRTATTALSCTANPSSTTELSQSVIGSVAIYGCPFFGTRVQYTASEITSPTPSPSRKHLSLHPKVLAGHVIKTK